MPSGVTFQRERGDDSMWLEGSKCYDKTVQGQGQECRGCCMLSRAARASLSDGWAKTYREVSKPRVG